MFPVECWDTERKLALDTAISYVGMYYP